MSCGNYEMAKKKDVIAVQYLTSKQKDLLRKEKERGNEWVS